MPTWQLVTAYGLVRLGLVLLQAAAILTLAFVAYGARFTLGGLAGAFLAAALGAAVFIALGQAIAAIAPSASAAMAIGQSLYFPLMFVSNLFLPVESLPAWLAAISRWSPAALVVDLVRPQLVPIEHSVDPWLAVALLLAYGLAGLLAAAAWFRWEPQR